MRLDPLIGLMVDRADRQIPLQFLERLFHLDQLQVERPELRRIATRDIRAQQLAAFPSSRLAQPLPVQPEAERVRRDDLILVGQLKVDDPPGRRPSLLAGRP